MKKIAIFSLLTLILLVVLAGCQQASNTSSKASDTAANEQGGDYTVRQEEISFESDGNTIYGRALVPEAEGTVPTVVFSHGFGGNHEQEETVQARLAQAGIAVYSFDFAGGTGYEPGRSEGAMTDMSVLTEAQNLKDAIAMIQKQEFVDTDRIYLMGASQGGVVTTLVAEELGDKIAGVELLYPAFSLFEDARNRFTSKDDIPDTYNLMGLTVGSRYFTDVYDMDICDHMTYEGLVHIYHGDADNLVDISNSEEAVSTFSNATLTTVQGGSHGFSTSHQEEIAPSIITDILGE